MDATHQAAAEGGPVSVEHGASAWTREDVLRVLRDIIRAHLASVPGAAQYSDSDAASWSADTRVGGPSLEIDSIELIGLRARVAEFFHTYESGIDDHLGRDPRLGAWADVVLACLQQRAERLTFLTGGSTGVPKPCVHATALLEQECDALVALFHDRARVVALVPSHHLYGYLFTVLLPRRLGVPVFDARGWGPGALSRELEAADLIVSFPAAWSGLVTAGAPLKGAVGACSAGACPPGVWRGVLDAGLSKMIEFYGSTETGGVAWRDRSDADLRLHGFWRRGTFNPEALERQQPAGAGLLGGGVWREHALMDRVEFTGERTFRLAGRVDHAVKVAGINVFPARVAAVLREHPKVADASVRLMRAEEGDRLKAFVVPSAFAGPAGSVDAGALRGELDAWCHDRLGAPERPRRWSFGPALPVGAMGKPADW